MDTHRIYIVQTFISVTPLVQHVSAFDSDAVSFYSGGLGSPGVCGSFVDLLHFFPN